MPRPAATKRVVFGDRDYAATDIVHILRMREQRDYSQIWCSGLTAESSRMKPRIQAPLHSYHLTVLHPAVEPDTLPPLVVNVQVSNDLERLCLIKNLPTRDRQ